MESQPERGSTFTVFLPLSGRVPDEPTNTVDSRPHGGSELILVAEDEPLVRDLAVRILQSAGYRTLAAADGEVAISLFNQQSAEIDMAVLDLMMPKIGGREVMRAIHGARPTLPVCLCSGSRMEEENGELVDVQSMQLIQKPFEPSTLLAVVRRALDQRESMSKHELASQLAAIPLQMPAEIKTAW